MAVVDRRSLSALQDAARERVSMRDFTMETRKMLDELCERCPEDSQWRTMRGRCLMTLGRYRDAELTFRSVLDREPDNETARKELAELHRRRLSLQSRAQELLDGGADTLRRALERGEGRRDGAGLPGGGLEAYRLAREAQRLGRMCARGRAAPSGRPAVSADEPTTMRPICRTIRSTMRSETSASRGSSGTSVESGRRARGTRASSRRAPERRVRTTGPCGRPHGRVPTGFRRVRARGRGATAEGALGRREKPDAGGLCGVRANGQARRVGRVQPKCPH